MSTVPISMRKLKEILRLKYGCLLSHRQVGKSLSISPSVVSRYATAVSEMQQSVKQAHESVSQAGKAGDALAAIQQAIGHINDMNTQVASAAEEQSVVAEQINQSISSISSIGEQTAGGAESTASASVEIAGMADELRQKISVFSV